MKNKIIIATLLPLFFAGCTHHKRTISTPHQHAYQAPTPAKQALFKSKMIEVAKSTLNDPRYQRMALNTPSKKAWFKTLMYRLWDRQITRQEFIQQGLAKYPNKAYEFTFVANGFQKRS